MEYLCIPFFNIFLNLSKHSNMFRNKIIWITGASAGIGREMALQFAKEGADVAISARRIDRLEQLSEEIEQLGRKSLIVPCDVSSESAVKDTVDKIITHFDHLDIAVANAGFGVGGKIESLSADDWRRQFDVNVIGLLNTVKYALPHLKKTKGSIVLMSSVAAMIASPQTAAYSASKAAVRAIGQTLSMELHNSGVNCTTIYPGFVDSEIGQVDNRGVYRPEYKDFRPQNLMWPTDKAVKHMLRGIKRRKRSVVVTGHGKFLAFLGRHFPGFIHWGTVKKILPSFD